MAYQIKVQVTKTKPGARFLREVPVDEPTRKAVYDLYGIKDVATGYLGRTYTSDDTGATETLTETWESKAAWLAYRKANAAAATAADKAGAAFHKAEGNTLLITTVVT